MRGVKLEGINMDLTEKPTGENAAMNWNSDEIRDGKIVTTAGIPYTQLQQAIVMQTIIGEAEGEYHLDSYPEG